MAEKSDDSKKTGKGDDTENTSGKGTPEKPNQAGEQFSRADLDKANAVGMAKGVERGKAEFLKELGFEKSGDLAETLKKGKEALAALDETRSDAQKALDAYKEEADRRFKEYCERTDPVLDKASKYIQREEERELFNSLGVKDTEMLKAMKLLHPAKEGESPEEHFRRIIEMRPSICQGEQKPKDPTKFVPDGTNEPEPTERQKLAAQIFAAQGGKPSQLEGVPKGD